MCIRDRYQRRVHGESSISRMCDQVDSYGGYDPSRYTGDMEDKCVELSTCAICHLIVKEPMECKTCETLFCESCINRWLSSNDSCPMKCSPPFTKGRVPKLVRQMLSTLTLTCKNADNGCKESLLYDSIDSHEKYCEYRRQNCSNEGCEAVVMVKDQAKHERSDCEWRKVICEKCQQTYVWNQEKDHDCIKTLLAELKKKDEMIKQLEENAKSQKSTQEPEENVPVTSTAPPETSQSNVEAVTSTFVIESYPSRSSYSRSRYCEDCHKRINHLPSNYSYCTDCFRENHSYYGRSWWFQDMMNTFIVHTMSPKHQLTWYSALYFQCQDWT
eukprot:TRINITY_DN1038_c0_g1_i2.p1 TRINITY_DN1038_c0_g1~~TRINITY_DN1038_c0_g1_i2.p1  ORF type:complete len:377 (+),score=33.70 TRINITY_DN1038_c0_g1_i2:145-1131(+)